MNDDDGGVSAFKQAQLRYRRQAPLRSDELVDFSRPASKADSRILSIPTLTSFPYKGPLFGLSNAPGFLYAPQALSHDLQTKLAYLAVSEFCEAPHATNMDGVPPKQGKEEINNLNESMWNLWKQQHGFNNDDGCLLTPSPTTTTMKKYRSFAKLSWATMGYQYDWTKRAYHENAKSPMPKVLSRLATLFAETCLLHNNTQPQFFTASAAITNYYHTKSVMGGHKDDLELALDKPVISFSFGLPAVFLLGGKTKQSTPVIPILVRPGDVMMLGGESRLCYHGMARVIAPAADDGVQVELPEVVSSSEFTLPNSYSVTWDDISSSISLHDDVPNADRKALQAYLEQHRININVRQVLPDGVSRIE